MVQEGPKNMALARDLRFYPRPPWAPELAVTVSASSRSSSRKTSARRKGAARKPARDIAQEVTDRIVAALEAGTVPWRSQHTGGGGEPTPPAAQRRHRA